MECGYQGGYGNRKEFEPSVNEDVIAGGVSYEEYWELTKPGGFLEPDTPPYPACALSSSPQKPKSPPPYDPYPPNMSNMSLLEIMRHKLSDPNDLVWGPHSKRQQK